jgi:hypothetical protein
MEVFNDTAFPSWWSLIKAFVEVIIAMGAIAFLYQNVSH